MCQISINSTNIDGKNDQQIFAMNDAEINEVNFSVDENNRITNIVRLPAGESDPVVHTLIEAYIDQRRQVANQTC